MKKNQRKTKPQVSVCCTTYNHELYIRDAIEGFLMQKTSFPVEIIIHDDASTDNTAKIVKEYAEKHPDLIIPILQKENQRSRGVKISSTYLYPIARGKYIAKCEGDDFWTDPLKLQKQFDFMEKNRQYIVCCHNSIIDFSDFNTQREPQVAILHDSQEITMQNTLANTDFNKINSNLVCPGYTSSVFFKNFKEYYKDLPAYLTTSISGDLVFWVYILSKGKGYFINEVMSVYRKNIYGITNTDIFSGLSFYNNRIRFYENANKLTNYKYNKIIKNNIKQYKLEIVKYPFKVFLKVVLNFYKTIFLKIKNNVNFYYIIAHYYFYLSNKLIRKKADDILSLSEKNVTLLKSDEQEEQALPGMLKYNKSGYYKYMLGRYLYSLKYLKNKTVLDTGCGFGWGSYLISDYPKKLISVDINENALTFAKQIWLSNRLNFLNKSILNLETLKLKFDVILSFEVIEHLSLKDGEKYIRSISNVANPSAVVIFSSYFPDCRKDALKHEKKNKFHLHIYTKTEMKKILKNNHFNNVRFLGDLLIKATKHD